MEGTHGHLLPGLLGAFWNLELFVRKEMVSILFRIGVIESRINLKSTSYQADTKLQLPASRVAREFSTVPSTAVRGPEQLHRFLLLGCAI